MPLHILFTDAEPSHSCSSCLQIQLIAHSDTSSPATAILDLEPTRHSTCQNGSKLSREADKYFFGIVVQCHICNCQVWGSNEDVSTS
jgi:hypothetical protein